MIKIEGWVAFFGVFSGYRPSPPKLQDILRGRCHFSPSWIANLTHEGARPHFRRQSFGRLKRPHEGLCPAIPRL